MSSIQKEPPLTKAAAIEIDNNTNGLWDEYEAYLEHKPFFYLGSLYLIYSIMLLVYFSYIYGNSLLWYWRKKCVQSFYSTSKFMGVVYFAITPLFFVGLLGAYSWGLKKMNELERRHVVEEFQEESLDSDIKTHKKVLLGFIVAFGVLVFVWQMYIMMRTECVPRAENASDIDARSMLLYHPFFNGCLYVFYMLSILVLFFSI